MRIVKKFLAFFLAASLLLFSVAASASGETSPASDASDPVLSCFPGLEWGMTRSEILNTAGKPMIETS